MLQGLFRETLQELLTHFLQNFSLKLFHGFLQALQTFSIAPGMSFDVPVAIVLMFFYEFLNEFQRVSQYPSQYFSRHFSRYFTKYSFRFSVSSIQLFEAVLHECFPRKFSEILLEIIPKLSRNFFNFFSEKSFWSSKDSFVQKSLQTHLQNFSRDSMIRFENCQSMTLEIPQEFLQVSYQGIHSGSAPGIVSGIPPRMLLGINSGKPPGFFLLFPGTSTAETPP